MTPLTLAADQEIDIPQNFRTIICDGIIPSNIY